MTSSLQSTRSRYQPQMPKQLEQLDQIELTPTQSTSCRDHLEAIQSQFPRTFGRPILKGTLGNTAPRPNLKVGIVFSGGQAAGGHNVIAGLYDAIYSWNADAKVYGFEGGPSGIVENKSRLLTPQEIDSVRNQGGFDLLGSGRTKIETQEQLAASKRTCETLGLDGLVVVGGDDSNTNAALLAEYFLQEGCQTVVVGVPKTIDGDLKSEHLEISFGFDTACKTYAELIGNIARDALSAKKYTHFIKLMGRSASHIALECALATQPNLSLIGEEIAKHQITLEGLVDHLSDLIEKRVNVGKPYGVILIPEGLIEFLPDMKGLIDALNQRRELTQKEQQLLLSLPSSIQQQLQMDRDPHGNVQVSLIETEKLLIEKVRERLVERKVKFTPLHHFFGYEGRAAYPTNFDANYTYALGKTAALLIREKATGYMSCIQNLKMPPSEWQIAGLPLTMMMRLERRKGKEKAVIEKTLVDLQGPAFKRFESMRKQWELEDRYLCPGPIQFFGAPSLTDQPPLSL